MIIVAAHSFDMDGCIFDQDYGYNRNPEDIIASHFDLFEPIKTQPHKKYVYCGSSRQTPYHDSFTSEQLRTPLASAMLAAIARHIGAIHNTFLFGDLAVYTEEYAITINNYEPGKLHSTRQQGFEEVYALLDPTKIALIYSQVANLCLHEPDADEISFNFYDDRPDILLEIFNFYTIHRQLLHKKVTLNLYQYSRCDDITNPVIKFTVRGSCEKPHTNYYAVVEYMIDTHAMRIEYSPEYGLKVPVLRTDLIDKEYIEDLVEIGINGRFSHRPGDGLIEYRKIHTEKLMTPLLNGEKSSNAASFPVYKKEFAAYRDV